MSNTEFRGENENRIVRVRDNELHNKVQGFSVRYEVNYQATFDAVCFLLSCGYTLQEIKNEDIYEYLCEV